MEGQVVRILVTGADGFIGSHLIPSLTLEGAHVRAIDLKDGDLTYPGIIDGYIDGFKPDLVIHLAAQVGRLFGELDSEHTIRSNAIMTGNVAQACAAHEVRLLYVSTSEVYGDQGSDWCSEDVQCVLPHNLYGLTKRWGEEIATLYSARTGLQIIRLSMPFGPGLPAGVGRAAIINFLDQAHRGVSIPVHKHASRCWCYVEDTVAGFLAVINSGEIAYTPEDIEVGVGIYNVGRSDNETSMHSIAINACEITGANALQQIKLIDAPRDQTVVKRLDMTKLYQLGWEPEVEIEEGMQMTYEMMLKDGTIKDPSLYRGNV